MDHTEVAHRSLQGLHPRVPRVNRCVRFDNFFYLKTIDNNSFFVGVDGAGTVVELGSDVEGIAKGDRV